MRKESFLEFVSASVQIHGINEQPIMRDPNNRDIVQYSELLIIRLASKNAAMWVSKIAQHFLFGKTFVDFRDLDVHGYYEGCTFHYILRSTLMFVYNKR